MAAARGAPMKSISIMWSEGVRDDEAATVVQTVKDLVKLAYDACFKAGVGLSATAIRPFGTWVLPSIPAGDPYSGTQWYVDTAYDRRRGQVVASRFLELVQAEPWQAASPHFDLAVLDRDLAATPNGAGFVLGSVLPGTAAVISVHRLREIGDGATRARALRRLVAHNFGHVLEVPSSGRVGVVEGPGRERHCTNVCAMRYAADVPELVALANEEAVAQVRLCPECTADLMRSVMLQRVSKN